MSSLLYATVLAADGGQRRWPRSEVASRIATATVSGLAVLAAIVYLVAPTQTAWAIAVQRVRNQQVPAHRVVLYGKAVNVQNRPLAGVRVVVARRVGKKLVVVMATTTSSDGTFRISGRVPGGRYVLFVIPRGTSHAVSATSALNIHPGSAYRVGIKLTRNDVVAVLPVRTY